MNGGGKVADKGLFLGLAKDRRKRETRVQIQNFRCSEDLLRRACSLPF
jgi:hypothetical protein